MLLRKITSLTLLVSFIPLVLTSIILFIVPEGRVAYWSDWRLFGLSKSQWGDIHINLGFLFLVAGCLHLYYNWKPIVAYLKNKAREMKILTPAFILALLINLVFAFGTLMNVPPFSTILDFGSFFKETAAVKYGEPPYGHAELSSLSLFAKRTGLDLETMKARLTAAKITYIDEKQNLLEIATANKTTPKTIYEIMNPVAQASAGMAEPFPKEPFPGMGRMVLGDFCKKYNLDMGRVVKAFATASIKADPEQTLKEIATANNSDPQALFEILSETVSEP